MKKLVFGFSLILANVNLIGQTDSISNSIIDSTTNEIADSTADVVTDDAEISLDDMDLFADLGVDSAASQPPLLPNKMMLTQKLFWGERGLMRRTNWIPLTAENRAIELNIRRKLLVTHQVVGYATVLGIIGTAISGTYLYNAIDKGNFGKYDQYKSIHEGFVAGTNAGYITGATIAFFNTPGLKGGESKKWDSIDWHKFFAYGHVAGMITTNILSGYAGENAQMRNAHRISGYATALAFTAAFVTIKF